MLAGDFSMIYSSENKNNDNINRAMMGRFRRFVNDMELKVIPPLGRRYTWSNERSSPTLVKLDRVLCTGDWDDIYPDCILQSQATEISDHCTLVPGLNDGVEGKKRFILKATGLSFQVLLILSRALGTSRLVLLAPSSAYLSSLNS
jgi:hypothetical protein